MVEAAHLLGGQRQARDDVAAEAVLDAHHPLELLPAAGRDLLPRHPRAAAVIDLAEEALQGRHDAVRALVLAIDRTAVLHHLLVGLAVIDDHERRLSIRSPPSAGRSAGARRRSRRRPARRCGGPSRSPPRLPEVSAPSCRRPPLQSRLKQRQVVERVAGHQHAVGRKPLRRDQAQERRSLGDAARQHVEEGLGRQQAVEPGRLDLGDRFRPEPGRVVVVADAMAEPGRLQLQPRLVGQQRPHPLAGVAPAPRDLAVDRRQRAEVAAVDHGRADVADDPVGARHPGVSTGRG